MDRSVPLLHGSQGCTAFGLVLFVRHFRETIPLQTTAMSEITTILGDMDNIEQALLNIHKRAHPALIGLCTTGITEARGDDVAGFLKLIRERHPELAEMDVVCVPTPDFESGFELGWGKAVRCIIEQLARPSEVRQLRQINLLPGCHQTPGDIEELREIIEAFGLTAVILPDLSGSLDGHIPENFLPHTLGGTTRAQVGSLSESALTIAIGEHMRPAAEALHRIAGVPFEVLDRLTGLLASDALIALLARVSGNPVPAKIKRQRSQLQDAMLDSHFYFSGKKVAIAAEPDLLWSIGHLLADMGCEIAAAVTTAPATHLQGLPTGQVLVGDLEDLEARAQGCDLLVTHSHGRQMAERLDLPFLRLGIPTFDRLGAAHRVSVGYRGTRNLIFEAGNLFIANQHDATPADWPSLAAAH
jgi:nitrogenase molybdenum-iron protein NifN